MGPGPLCFLVVYGLGVMLNKTPKINSDYTGFAMVPMCGLLYSLTGDYPPGRNPFIQCFVSGMGIGILAWLAHYYQESIPILKRFFPDNLATKRLKAANKPCTCKDV